MGVVNVTPDSFSDGGVWWEPGAAVEHGLALRDQGADLVDVGGESTRPGAERVPEEEELRRVLPVVRELAAAGVLVSIDTMRSGVARSALDSGAVMVNDVSGGLADPDMLGTMAVTGAPFVVMHWRRHSVDMQAHTDVRRRRRRRGRPPARAARGRESRRASTPTGSRSTPGWASPRPARTTGSCSRTSTRCTRSASRCCSGRAASASSAPCSPTTTGSVRRPSATTPPSRPRRSRPLPGAWCLRVHEVRGTADAVRVVEAWAAAAQGGRDG